MPEPYWYLLIVGVDPELQGRGLGSALVGTAPLGKATWMGDATQRTGLKGRRNANTVKQRMKPSMSEYLAWALGRAREHTLALVADVPREAMLLQATPNERHPAWLLGHLLLADTYLLFLLAVEPLADDFPSLLEHFGPQSAPDQSHDDSTPQLIDRLRRTNAVRLAHVRAMPDRDLAQPMPDVILAHAQPTIGHHLHALVFHEGYHSGQLSSWRKTHGFTAVQWTFGPARTGAA